MVGGGRVRGVGSGGEGNSEFDFDILKYLPSGTETNSNLQKR